MDENALLAMSAARPLKAGNDALLVSDVDLAEDAADLSGHSLAPSDIDVENRDPRTGRRKRLRTRLAET
jgi:hypothetical protein